MFDGAPRRADGTCWTCAKPRCFGRVGHTAGRLHWAATWTLHARPRSLPARLRLLWHDFVLHGLLNRGVERCQDCGRAYDFWHAENAVWRRVMGSEGGLLCQPCFDVRCVYTDAQDVIR